MKLDEIKTTPKSVGDALTAEDRSKIISDIYNGNFVHQGEDIVTLAGSPSIINGDFRLDSNKIEDFVGAPEQVNGDVQLQNNKLRSLKDIHKHLKHIAGELYLDDNYIKSHVLGLLKISGLKKVYFCPEDLPYPDIRMALPALSSATAFGFSARTFSKVEKIINKHLAGDRNLLACQEELLDAGLDTFAQL